MSDVTIVTKKPRKKVATVSENVPVKASAPAKTNGGEKLPPVTRHTVPDSKRLTIAAKWRKDNPKSPMSPAAKRFDMYREVKTVGEYREKLRQLGKPHFANLDLARDRARGYINFDFAK